VVIGGRVAVLVQQLLHAAEGNSGQVSRVLELEEPLQVRCPLAPAHVHALGVHRIQPGHTHHGEGEGPPQFRGSQPHFRETWVEKTPCGQKWKETELQRCTLVRGDWMDVRWEFTVTIHMQKRENIICTLHIITATQKDSITESAAV